MDDAKKLLSGSTIIFVGTIVGSFFAYLFNMLVGRFLGPEKYGEFAAILSLMAILSVTGGAVMIVTMKFSSELYAQKNFLALRKLFKKFSIYVGTFALCLIAAALILIKPIASFFQITDLLPIVIMIFGFLFAFLAVVNRGVLQGTQRFTAISVTGALEMALRLLLGVILIKIGLSLFGAMLGIAFASAIIYFVTFLPLLKILKNKSAAGSSDFSFNKKEIFSYTGPALFSSVLLALAINVDIMLVKHYFDPETAGIYAAVSTIGKIILYATGPIVSVMFPLISEKTAQGDKHYKLFLLSLGLTLIGALIILGIYYIAPGTVIRVLYGSRFVEYYYLLPQIGFAILFYALVNILCNYYLSIKNFVFLPIFAVVLIAQITLIAQYHSSLEMVIKILIFTLGLLFTLLLGYYLFTKKEQLISYFKHEYEVN